MKRAAAFLAVACLIVSMLQNPFIAYADDDLSSIEAEQEVAREAVETEAAQDETEGATAPDQIDVADVVSEQSEAAAEEADQVTDGAEEKAVTTKAEETEEPEGIEEPEEPEDPQTTEEPAAEIPAETGEAAAAETQAAEETAEEAETTDKGAALKEEEEPGQEAAETEKEVPEDAGTDASADTNANTQKDDSQKDDTQKDNTQKNNSQKDAVPAQTADAEKDAESKPQEEAKAEPKSEDRAADAAENEEKAKDDKSVETDQEAEQKAEDTLSGTCEGDITWSLDDAGTLTINGNGEMTDIYGWQNWNYMDREKVKKLVLGKGITDIPYYIGYFNNLASIEVNSQNTVLKSDGSVLYKNVPTGVELVKMLQNYTGAYVIPADVTSIKNNAFTSCGNLTGITVPANVKVIGKGVLAGCGSLSSVTLPDGMTFIPDSMFANCSSLTSISIPNGVTSIDSSAFSGCSALKEVSIPDSVTSIGGFAFEGCESLENFSIPSTVTSIGQYAFNGCKKLKSIDIPYGVKTIEPITFSGCISVTSLTIPSSVTSIAYAAFNGCASLQKVTIPASVKTIGYAAFANAGLSEIRFEGDAPTTDTAIGCFGGVTATAYYYPNSTWTEEVRQGYKGNITWKALSTTQPAAVQNLKAEPAGKNRVKLSWSASPGAEGYMIYGKKNGTYGYVGMTTRGTTFTDTKALCTDYNFYWVFPYVTDEKGKQHPGPCPKYVFAKGILPAVTGVKAASVKGGVKLSWNSVSGAEGYLVYGIVGGQPYKYVGMTTRGTTFTDTKASTTQYNYYWVYAYFKDGSRMIVGQAGKYTYGKALKK